MPAANILQLRQLLAERFPGLRTRLDGQPGPEKRFWAAGLPQIDGPLRGGLPRGAITEINSRGKSAGSATLLRGLLCRAAAQKQIIALIDGSDSLDVTQLGEAVLSRLLWVRCRSAAQALQAADWILRDRNFSLVLLDLNLVSEKQLRRVAATTWYRFQRLVEQTSTVCVVLAPRHLAAPAQARVELSAPFSMESLEPDADQLLLELKLEAVDARHPDPAVESLQKSA